MVTNRSGARDRLAMFCQTHWRERALSEIVHCFLTHINFGD